MDDGQREWLNRHAHQKPSELTTDQKATLGKIADGLRLMNPKGEIREIRQRLAKHGIRSGRLTDEQLQDALRDCLSLIAPNVGT
jgi:hypothetical protein